MAEDRLLRQAQRPRTCSTRLDDTRFNLILIGGPHAADPTDQRLTIHQIPDLATNVAALARVGIRAPSYYLLRPDVHIGLGGVRLQSGDVQRYFSDRFF